MSLQYLSGVKRQAKKTARIEKKAVKKEAKMSPVTKTRVNKLQVQSKIRKTFVKKAEPIKVEEEEIIKEQEQPADFQPSEETPEETKAEVEETQAEEEQADMGIYYPNFGKAKKGKLKSKLKTAIKKGKDRKANDTHTAKQKLAHKLAKAGLILPRTAFLSILLLGKVLEKTPVKINLSKALVKNWQKNGKQFKEFWYKMGGEPDILVNQINKGAKATISGDLGVVTETAVVGTVATASPILIGILKILKTGGNFAKNNPSLVAKGQEVAKAGLLNASKQLGGDKLNTLNTIADTITKQLPKDQQDKINNIRKNIPKATTDKLIKTATQDVKTTAEATGLPKKTTTTSNNKNMLLIGGGAVAILGAYLLMKKK